MDVRTLLEDAEAWFVDKPAGVAVIPGRGEGEGDALRGRLEAARGFKLWVVHRLDRETTGVVVFAKTAEAHRRFSLAFEGRRTRKEYRALTWGAPRDEAGVADCPLKPARRSRMRVADAGDPEGKPARTAYRTLGRAEDGRTALLALEPETGRQHQIRVHLRALGAPILGDDAYAPAEARISAPRLMLHAASLMLPRDDGGPSYVVRAPDPDDFVATGVERGLDRQLFR